MTVKIEREMPKKAPDPVEAEAYISTTPAVSSDPSTWTVLIVEDDFDNLNLVRWVLAYHHVTVYAAWDGLEGLEILERLTPTVVLVDLSMPYMDGRMMLEQIRSRPETAHLPVIAVTGHAMVGDRERILSSGFDGYISKPFPITSLVDEIMGFVKKADPMSFGAEEASIQAIPPAPHSQVAAGISG